jgi:sulfite exporter TauE/SafE
MSLTLSVLVASLIGSVHCTAMCGGFVCLYAGEARGMKTHAAYNAGRLASYLLVGGIAGTLGSLVDSAGTIAGIARLAAVTSGALLVAWGGTLMSRSFGVRLGGSGGPSLSQRWLGPLLARTRRRSPVVRAGAVGLLSTLLPCGWLYAFVVTAAGTGHPGSALLVMLVFWAGTLPAMLAMGYGVQRLAGPLRRRLPLVSAVVVVAIGLLSMLGRLQPGVSLHSRADATHAHAR